jgi:hypothetical protein
MSSRELKPIKISFDEVNNKCQKGFRRPDNS